MSADDAKVAAAARKFVAAVALLEEEGGDQAAVVNQCRIDLEKAVQSEAEPVVESEVPA